MDSDNVHYPSSNKRKGWSWTYPSIFYSLKKNLSEKKRKRAHIRQNGWRSFQKRFYFSFCSFTRANAGSKTLFQSQTVVFLCPDWCFSIHVFFSCFLACRHLHLTRLHSIRITYCVWARNLWNANLFSSVCSRVLVIVMYTDLNFMQLLSGKRTLF